MVARQRGVVRSGAGCKGEGVVSVWSFPTKERAQQNHASHSHACQDPAVDAFLALPALSCRVVPVEFHKGVLQARGEALLELGTVGTHGCKEPWGPLTSSTGTHFGVGNLPHSVGMISWLRKC